MKTWRVDLPNFMWNKMPQGHGTLIVCDNGAVMACTDFGDYCYHFRQRDFTPQRLLSMIHTKKPKTYNDYLLGKFCWSEMEYDGKGTVAWIRRIIRELDDSVKEKEKHLQLIKSYDNLETEWNFDLWAQEQEVSDDVWELKSHKYTCQQIAFVTEFLPRALKKMIKDGI